MPANSAQARIRLNPRNAPIELDRARDEPGGGAKQNKIAISALALRDCLPRPIIQSPLQN